MTKKYKLPEILYKLLAEHNMTQQQLADKLVCGQNTIYKWLRKDVMPNLYFVMLMAEIFNVSVDYLIYGQLPRPTAKALEVGAPCGVGEEYAK